MKLSEYQEKAIKTAVYPADVAVPYLTMGLAGEAGEVLNKAKKIIRGDYDDDPERAEEVYNQIAMELGDTLWYIAVLANELGSNLDLIAAANICLLYTSPSPRD